MDPVTIRVEAEVGKAIKDLQDLRKAYLDNLASFTGTKAEVASAINSFVGDAAIRRGQIFAQVIKEIGGATQLTAREAAQVGPQLTEILAKYQAMGQRVPQQLQAIASQLKDINAANKQAAATKGFLDQFGGGQSLSRVNALVKAIEQLGGVQKLTASEQRTVNRILDEGDQKYRALGVSGPAALRRILDETRQVNRQPLFGTQAVTNAERYVKALQEVGGVARLTATEQKKLYDVVSAGAAQLAARGKEIPQAWQQILKSTQQTTQEIPKFFDQMFFRIAGAATTGALAGKIFVDAWRNSLNLVKEAWTDTLNVIGEGAETANILKSFQGLAKAIDIIPTDLVGRTRQATAGLVSDFKIMESANRAMLFGLHLTSEEFARMTEAGIILGRGMNLGPERSVERLILALGRMSPRILDDLGIIVKITDANKKWADANNVNYREMTANQKQLAFQEEALRKIYEKTRDLGGITLNLQDRVTQGLVIWENYRRQLGLSLNQSGVLTEGLKALGDAFVKALGPNQEESIQKITSLIEDAAIASVRFARVTIDVAKNVVEAWDLAQKSVFKFYSTLRTAIDILAPLIRVTAHALESIPGTGEFRGQLDLSLQALNLFQAAIKGIDTAVNGLDTGKATQQLDTLGKTLDGIIQRMQKAKGTKVELAPQSGKPVFELGQGEEELTGIEKEHAKAVEALEKRINRLNVELIGAYKNGIANTEMIRRWGEQIRNVTTDAEALGVKLPDAIRKASAAVAEADFNKKFKKPLMDDFLQFNQREIKRIQREREADEKENQKRSINNLQKGLDEWVKAYYDAKAAEVKGEEEALKEKLELIHLEAQKRRQMVDGDADFRQETISAIDAWEINEAKRVTDEYHQQYTARAKEIDSYTEAIKAGLEDMTKIWQQALRQAFSGEGNVNWGRALEASTQAIFGRIGRNLFTQGPFANFIGNTLIKGVTNLFGANIGAALGEMMGPIGELVGQLGGQLLSKLVSHFHQSTDEKILKDVGRDWGVSISKGLSQKIAEDSKRLKDRYAATLLNLGKIIEEAGGVTSANVAIWTRRTRDLFSAIERGQLSVAEAGKVLDEVFPQLAEHINKTTGLASEQLVELVSLAQRFGVESKAITDFINEQTSKILSGFNALAQGLTFDWLHTDEMEEGKKSITDIIKRMTELKGLIADLEKKQFLSGNQKVALRDYRKELADLQKDLDKRKAAMEAGAKAIGAGTAEEIQRLQRLAVVAFEAGIASGKNLLEVIQEIGPGIDEINLAVDTFGLEKSEAFGDISSLRKFVAENEKLAAAVGGVNDMAVGLANTNRLNKDNFEDLGKSASELFNAMLNKGVSSKTALKALQPVLQALWEAAKRQHLQFDENTQNLINVAEDQGIIGKQFQSTESQQLDTLDRIADTLDRIAEAFGVGKDASTDVQGATEDATGAVDDMSLAIDRNIAKWHELKDAATDATDAAAAGVDKVSFGESPGGLKEWAPFLRGNTVNFTQFANSATGSLSRVYSAINKIPKDMSMGATFNPYPQRTMEELKAWADEVRKMPTAQENTDRYNDLIRQSKQPGRGLVLVQPGAVQISTWTIDEQTKVERVLHRAIRNAVAVNDDDSATFWQEQTRAFVTGH